MKKIFSILFCAVLFLCVSVVPSYAAIGNLEELPDVPTDSGLPYREYILTSFVEISSGETKYILRVFEDQQPLNISHKYITSSSEVATYNNSENTISMRYYQLKSSGWYFNSSLSKTIDAGGRDAITLKTNTYNKNFKIEASTLDIFVGDTSELFFQAPPSGLAVVIARAMEGLMMKVLAAMRIIVLCGIGCLALLIGYHLLAKVLSRYLPK